MVNCRPDVTDRRFGPNDESQSGRISFRRICIMTTISTGLSMAASAAVIAVAAAAAPSAAVAKGASDAKVIHCYGINSCKGTSDCKTAKNECKGQNACKGQGFKAMTSTACTAAGGSLTEAK
jgi:hypothetical protein